MQVLRRLWADDRGAIITAEWILIVSVLVFGLIPGLVALRNSMISSLATLGNLLTAIVPNFTFSGFGVGNSGSNIAQVGGFVFTGGTANVLTSSQIAPTDVGAFVQVDPAP